MASYMNSGLVFRQAGAASTSAVPWRLGQEENDIVSVENLGLLISHCSSCFHKQVGAMSSVVESLFHPHWAYNHLSNLVKNEECPGMSQ